jgi:hypothetical protein
LNFLKRKKHSCEREIWFSITGFLNTCLVVFTPKLIVNHFYKHIISIHVTVEMYFLFLVTRWSLERGDINWVNNALFQHLHSHFLIFFLQSFFFYFLSLGVFFSATAYFLIDSYSILFNLGARILNPLVTVSITWFDYH